MRLFKKHMTDEAASRIANYGLEQMGFYNPEKEIDILDTHDYLTRVIKDYDELIAKVEKRSMVKGALITVGVLYVANKVKEAKADKLSDEDFYYDQGRMEAYRYVLSRLEESHKEEEE